MARLAPPFLTRGAHLIVVRWAMYLRESKQRRSDGSVANNCGRADDPDVIEQMRRLAKSIRRLCSTDEIAGAGGDSRLICAWLYGDLHVLEGICK